MFIEPHPTLLFAEEGGVLQLHREGPKLEEHGVNLLKKLRMHAFGGMDRAVLPNCVELLVQHGQTQVNSEHQR
jgi:hypothetical protein